MGHRYKFFFLVLWLGITLNKLTAQEGSKGKKKAESSESSTSSTEEKKKAVAMDSDNSKWIINIEVGLQPIYSVNSKTIPSFQGNLGLEYKVTPSMTLGLFGQSLIYHQNLDVANIDAKIIDLSSAEYNSLGLRATYTKSFGKVSIIPQLDLSYNFFLCKAIDYAIDKKSFLDYRYMSLTPKINFGYNFSETFMLGVYGGYNAQITALKGSKIDAFDPNAFIGGLVTRINVR